LNKETDKTHIHIHPVISSLETI